MLKKTCIAVLATAQLAIAAPLPIAIFLDGDATTAPFLGQAFDARTNSFKAYGCLGLNRTPTYSVNNLEPITFESVYNVGTADAVKTVKGAGQLDTGDFFFNFNGYANVAQKYASNEFSSKYISVLKIPTHTIDNRINDFNKLPACSQFENDISLLGTHYVGAIAYGGQLITTIEINFSNTEDKARFNAGIGIEAGGGSVSISDFSASLSAGYGSLNEATKERASITVSIEQRGGDPLTLLSVLNNQTLLTCSLTNTQACSDFIRSAEDYSVNFEAQMVAIQNAVIQGTNPTSTRAQVQGIRVYSNSFKYGATEYAEFPTANHEKRLKLVDYLLAILEQSIEMNNVLHKFSPVLTDTSISSIKQQLTQTTYQFSLAKSVLDHCLHFHHNHSSGHEYGVESCEQVYNKHVENPHQTKKLRIEQGVTPFNRPKGLINTASYTVPSTGAGKINFQTSNAFCTVYTPEGNAITNGGSYLPNLSGSTYTKAGWGSRKFKKIDLKFECYSPNGYEELYREIEVTEPHITEAEVNVVRTSGEPVLQFKGQLRRSLNYDMVTSISSSYTNRNYNPLVRSGAPISHTITVKRGDKHDIRISGKVGDQAFNRLINFNFNHSQSAPIATSSTATFRIEIYPTANRVRVIGVSGSQYWSPTQSSVGLY